jgi:hypothetical protein
VANVEEFLRIWAVRWNISDWDEWGAERGKNCYFYQEGEGGLWHLFAWDMELTYETGRLDSFLIPTSPTATFNPGGFGEVNRMLNRPKIKRMYYGILDEMVNGPFAWFTSAYLSDYMDRLSQLGMANTAVGLAGGYIDQRRDRLRARVAPAVYPQVRLAITTNGGNNFSTASSSVNIAGTGPANICRFLVNGEDYDMSFTSMTNWEVRSIELLPGANPLSFVGLNLRGDLIDTDSITVTSTAGPRPPPVITRLDPSTAEIGDEIAILGSNFLRSPRVFFGSVEAAFVSYEPLVDPAVITARVPTGAGTVAVRVRNRDSQESNTAAFTYPGAAGSFVRGDVNGDGLVDVSDPVRTLFHLFSGTAIDCQDAADADDNELLNLSDAIRELDFLFRRGPAPPTPFPSAGPDPAGAALGCMR